MFFFNKKNCQVKTDNKATVYTVTPKHEKNLLLTSIVQYWKKKLKKKSTYENMQCYYEKVFYQRLLLY